MGTFLCRQICDQSFSDDVLQSILSFCDKKQALKLRKISPRFKVIVDEFVSIQLEIELLGRVACQLTISAVICGEKSLQKLIFITGLHWKTHDVEVLKHLDVRSLCLTVYADGSSEYDEVIQSLKNAIVIPIAITSHLRCFSLTVWSTKRCVDSGNVFPHLRSLCRVLRNVETMRLVVYPHLTEANDFVGYLLELHPQNLTLLTDYPEVEALLAQARQNFTTNISIEPSDLNSEYSHVDGDVFVLFEELMEEWMESTCLHLNSVSMTFRLPSQLWKSSSRQCCGVDSEYSSQFPEAIVVLEHSIQTRAFNIVYGRLALSMKDKQNKNHSLKCTHDKEVKP